jgi:hypothetical protein
MCVCVCVCACEPGTVVGIATDYGLDGPGIKSRCGRDFPHLSRPALESTQRNRHTLQTHTTDTQYRHTLQTHTTDTHYRQTLQTHTTDTFLFISHTTNVLLLKSRCNIFIGFRIIKEMLGLVRSGTPCIYIYIYIYTQTHTRKSRLFLLSRVAVWQWKRLETAAFS